MSVAKITEITASSASGFESAVKNGLRRAAKTLKNITGAWISEQKVTVRDGEIDEYRVTMRVTFILDD
ncbi:MAG: dodecin family protein [Acidobacteriota bacterium]|nr:dodecin family protein [Acidobacteriota bacterium]MDH3524922.1 dodecin family protein [Acidobacteriota bacterium]